MNQQLTINESTNINLNQMSNPPAFSHVRVRKHATRKREPGVVAQPQPAVSRLDGMGGERQAPPKLTSSVRVKASPVGEAYTSSQANTLNA
jgi:hypothetical protein